MEEWWRGGVVIIDALVEVETKHNKTKQKNGKINSQLKGLPPPGISHC